MRTTEAILAEIRNHKTCSKQQLYRYFAAFNIKPMGVRQRPQLYADDTAERILKQLGIVTEAGCGKPGCPNAAPPDSKVRQEAEDIMSRFLARKRAKRSGGLVSMNELRHERSKGARRAA